MRISELPEVKALGLFNTMSDQSFERLMQAAYLQTFPSQLALLREGDTADFLYVLVEGAVELFANNNGREETVAVVKPVETFILAAVLKDAVYLMSARTICRSKILLVPAADVLNAFEEDDAFARAIVAELASRYRGVIKEHKNMKLRSAVERLANRLIRYEAEQGGNGILELPHEKRILASLLGMTPENLSRAFKTLKPYGVDVDGPTVRLTDLPSLKTMAKPNPLIDDEVR